MSVAVMHNRLVALTFLHRKFGAFITVLHNTDRLMDIAVKLHHVSTNNDDGKMSLLKILDSYLLWYFILVGVPVNIYYVLTSSVVNSRAGTVWCVVLAFNNLSCFSTDLQFIRCACMLARRFRIINNELELIASVWHFKRGLVPIYLPNTTYL